MNWTTFGAQDLVDLGALSGRSEPSVLAALVAAASEVLLARSESSPNGTSTEGGGDMESGD